MAQPEDLPAYPLPDGVRIRRIRYTDHAAIRSFCCANDGEPWTEIVELHIQNDLNQLAYAGDIEFVVLVATYGEGLTPPQVELAGLIVFAPFENRADAIESKLLAVEPDWRRKYIALNLKYKLMDYAASKGIEIVTSDVHKSNKPMQALNRKLLAQASPDPDEPEYLQTVVRPPLDDRSAEMYHPTSEPGPQ